MTRPEFGPALDLPVVVGALSARGALILRRVVTAVSRTAVIGGIIAALVPVGVPWPWLVAVCVLALVAGLVLGTRHDLRRVEQLGVSYSPRRRLVLRGPWVTHAHEPDEVEAVQVWCDCRSARRSVAPHRDGLEVLLRGGRAVRVESATVFPANVAITLGELLAPAGIRVVDWGETDATVD